MKAWLEMTMPTELGGTRLTPGRTYCSSRSRRGAYIGCVKVGAAMMGAMGSRGFQVINEERLMRELIRRGTVMAGLRRTIKVVLRETRSSAGAWGGSTGRACT